MFQKTFCSSPWFHLRVLPTGNYNVCRWASSWKLKKNVKDFSLEDFYNSSEMSDLRLQMLNGEASDTCSFCHYEDKFDKLSGRKKQLLKSGITDNDFELKLRASPHYDYFKYSLENSGKSIHNITDIQIDLGNMCNSSCIMCSPRYSSRVEQDYKLLHNQHPDIFKNLEQPSDWTKDTEAVDKFIDELLKLPNLKYVHLLGGETLYMKSFYKICDALVDTGKSKNIILGTTTNGTIFNDKIEKYIKNFRQFHLGVSIESVSPLNDYIRYPSNINDILSNIQQYKSLQSEGLFICLRITPNIFTIYEFDEIAKYIIENKLSVESCDILKNPSLLRMELLPQDIREEIIIKLKRVIDLYGLEKHKEIINTRNNDFIDQVIANNIIEYYDFMKNFKEPENITTERYNLVRFLKAFESLRNNRIVDYVPRYTEFLTNYGY